jgi:hypothetical protein
MQKVPVLATLRATYSFVFHNYLRILGVVWVPMGLTLVLMMWQMAPLIAAMPTPGAVQNPALIMAAFGHIMLFEAACFLLTTAMTVGVVRMALGLEIRTPFLYLPSGGEFGRLLLAFFLVFLIFMGIAVAVSIVGEGALVGMILHTAGPNPDPVQTAAQIQKFTPAILAVTYSIMFIIFIRLAMLLPAIVLREKQLGIGRNWALTRGNFFRLLAVLVGALLPMLVSTALMFIVIGILAGPSVGILAAFGSQAQQLAWSQRIFALYTEHWYIFFPLWLLVTPAYYGPFLGAGAFAYRAIVPVTEPVLA